VTSERPTVLVVDDEQSVADTYALQLRDRYETRVAYGGQAGLAAMDDEVDAVLWTGGCPTSTATRCSRACARKDATVRSS